jgi:hypothetical protein
MIAPLRSLDEITLVHGFLDSGATTAVVLGWYGVAKRRIVPDQSLAGVIASDATPS